MLFYNNTALYKSECALTHKSIITIYNPKDHTLVYENDIWHSDKRDPLSYGIMANFSQSILEQIAALYTVVPKKPIINDNNRGSENCAYCNDFAYGKNCYLAYISWK
jgi:hypothetical protein